MEDMCKIPYKHLTVIIMPTDYCNMQCVYCFNSRKTNVEKKQMTLDVLEHVFSITIPFYDEIRFVWHGGEPTSLGVDFYEKAICLQQKYIKKDRIVENSIQSNLTLLSDEMVDFLLKNNFHIGGSFDGLNNEFTRHNTSAILAGRKKVIDAGGKVGFICVVQSQNINNLIEDYNWFKKEKINYTLNMYMTTPPYGNDPLYVHPDILSKKICELFDYWMNDVECNIHISYFEEFLQFLILNRKSMCCYNSCLGKTIGIQYNGDIYNCNRDFDKEYCYGNAMQYSNIKECFESPGFNKSVDAAFNRRKYCKENCDIFDFCAGWCNSVAVMGGDMYKPNLDVCQSLISIYNYIKFKVNLLLESNDTSEKLNPFVKDIITKR